ncbi:hypothetical protein MYU51_021403 [Penicillium brevicompactum]
MGFALVPQLRHNRRWTHHRAATTAAIQIYWAQTAGYRSRFLGGSVLGRPHGCRAGSPSETAQTHRKALFQWLLWLRETGYNHLRMKHRADTAVRMGLALPASTRPDSRVTQGLRRRGIVIGHWRTHEHSLSLWRHQRFGRCVCLASSVWGRDEQRIFAHTRDAMPVTVARERVGLLAVVLVGIESRVADLFLLPSKLELTFLQLLAAAQVQTTYRTLQSVRIAGVIRTPIADC